MQIASTAYRVADQTDPATNEKIRRHTNELIRKHSVNVQSIDRRLEELDREWDIERTLETNGSSLLLFGIAMSVVHSRLWLVLPTAVGAFCLQHALQGWCPPIELFRRMGVRTAREIEEERTALKAIRGDFRDLPDTITPQGERDLDDAISAARR